MTDGRTIYLVSCVGKKRTDAMEAKDLYASEWLLRARAFLERTQSPWFILSARYRLVAPHQSLAPYERTHKQHASLGEAVMGLKRATTDGTQLAGCGALRAACRRALP